MALTLFYLPSPYLRELHVMNRSDRTGLDRPGTGPVAKDKAILPVAAVGAPFGSDVTRRRPMMARGEGGSRSKVTRGRRSPGHERGAQKGAREGFANTYATPTAHVDVVWSENGHPANTGVAVLRRMWSCSTDNQETRKVWLVPSGGEPICLLWLALARRNLELCQRRFDT